MATIDFIPNGKRPTLKEREPGKTVLLHPLHEGRSLLESRTVLILAWAGLVFAFGVFAGFGLAFWWEVSR